MPWKRKPKKAPNPAASALGKLGARARLAGLSPAERSEFGRKLAEARWHRKPEQPEEGVKP